jgi:hypothetical protein
MSDGDTLGLAPSPQSGHDSWSGPDLDDGDCTSFDEFDDGHPSFDLAGEAARPGPGQRPTALVVTR